MIYVVDKKRKIIIYLLNTFGLILYPFFFIWRKKWHNRREEILAKLKSGQIHNIHINLVDRLGDAISATAMIRVLKKQYPNISITLIANKTVAEIFKNCPHITDIIEVKNNWVSKSLVDLVGFAKIFDKSFFAAIKNIRQRKIDLLIEVKGDFRNLLFFDIYLGAKYTAGYASSGFGWMLDWEIEYPKNTHEVDVKLLLAKNLGATNDYQDTEFFLSEDDKNKADAIFTNNGILANDISVVLHIGSTWEPRAWPLAKFIELAKRIKDAKQGKILLIGAKDEKIKIDAFLREIPDAIRIDGLLTIGETAAIMRKASLVIGNDSGPIHLARAVKSKFIGIYGPESLERVGPQGHGIAIQKFFSCQPCGQTACPHSPNCIQSITTDEIFNAFQAVVGNHAIQSEPKERICIINNAYKPFNRGGADRIAQICVEELKKQGYSLQIITTKGTFNKNRKPEKDVLYLKSLFHNLHKLPIFFRLFWHVWDMFNVVNYFKIKKALKKFKPNIVITHNLKGIGSLTPRAVQNLNLKHIHTLHDIQLLHPSGLLMLGQEKKLNTFYARFFRHANSFLFRNVKYIISPSGWLLKQHTTHGFFKKANTQTILNPVVLNKHSRTTDRNDIFTFLFVGALEKHKGLDILIENFITWQTKYNRKAMLNIIGSGSLTDKIKRNDIFYLGEKTNEDVQKNMQKAHVVIAPSICYENSPTVIFESLINNTPVITSDLGGTKELADHFNAILFSHKTTNDLAEKMELCFIKYSEIIKKTALAKKAVVELSPQKYMEKIKRLFKI